MPPECAPGLLQPDYRVTEARGCVTDHSRWALSIVMRAAWAAGRPLEEGPLDGEKVVAEAVDLSDRQAYRTKLNQCLEGLGRLLADRRFDRPRNLMGLEIELNLAGSDGMPRMMNQQVLQRIASRDFQTELGMFNLEVNIVPHRLGGRVFDQLSEELRTGLAYAHRKAGEVDAGIVMIGILPTLGEHDVVSANLSDVDRYTLLNDQMAAARGRISSWISKASSDWSAPRPRSPRKRPARRYSCISR